MSPSARSRPLDVPCCDARGGEWLVPARECGAVDACDASWRRRQDARQDGKYTVARSCARVGTRNANASCNSAILRTRSQTAGNGARARGHVATCARITISLCLS
eukprot:IDg2727t1